MNYTRLDTAGSKARDLYHHQNELTCMRPGTSYDGHEHGWSHRYECDEWAALEREWQARVEAARAEGLEAGRALVALHAATARKEGRAEGLRLAKRCHQVGVGCDAIPEIEALIDAAETGG